MSLNGFKLVVTRLASPARIRLLRLVLAGILQELEYSSPVILSRGFCTFVARKSKTSSKNTATARRRQVTGRSPRTVEEAEKIQSLHMALTHPSPVILTTPKSITFHLKSHYL